MQLLYDLSTILSASRMICQDKDQQHASKFNPLLQFFRFGENKLSEILAYFLTPEASHGQGAIFLKSFLSEFVPHVDITNFGRVDVRCEQCTHEQRRLDIYIRFDNNFGIGIENKIWAGDQLNQISHYNEFLRKLHNENYCLVYLSPFEKDPAEHSISRDELTTLKTGGKFVSRDHSTGLTSLLSVWINECGADNIKAFLKDLLQYINHTINNEPFMNDNNEVAEYILQSEETLKSAQSIARAGNEVRKRLFQILKGQLEAVANQNGVAFYYDIDASGDQYSGFGFTVHEETSELSVCYEFQTGGNRNLIWGVAGDSNYRPEMNELISAQLGPGSISREWYWYKYDECRNWTDGNHVLVEIYNEELAKRIGQRLSEIIPRLRQLLHDKLEMFIAKVDD